MPLMLLNTLQFLEPRALRSTGVSNSAIASNTCFRNVSDGLVKSYLPSFV